jgi:hypothetical protein
MIARMLQPWIANFQGNPLSKRVKGSPVHIANVCAWSGEGSDHFESCIQHFPAFLQETLSNKGSKLTL